MGYEPNLEPNLKTGGSAGPALAWTCRLLRYNQLRAALGTHCRSTFWWSRSS